MTWKYDGRVRPVFAEEPRQGQQSVWDYPRPPIIETDGRQIVVRARELLVADSHRALRVLETASPPTYYLPPGDVRSELLKPASARSFCEWKGEAVYFDLEAPWERIEHVGWSYPRPRGAFAALAGYLAFYPAKLECYVADERVLPQPGGFYGGWLTGDIAGPVKGSTGSEGW